LTVQLVFANGMPLKNWSLFHKSSTAFTLHLLNNNKH